jgi:hypothetical protein
VIESREHHNFHPNDILEPLNVIGGEGSFGWLSEIHAHDSVLLVFDRQPPQADEQLQVIDPHDGRTVVRAGAPGQEQSAIGNTVSIGRVPGASGLFVWDYRNRRLGRYMLGSSGPEPTAFFHLRDRIPLFQMAWLGNDMIVANGMFSDEILRFYKADASSQTLEYLHAGGQVLHPREEPTVARELSRNMMAADPTVGRVVTAFMYANRIHIYDTSGKLLHVTGGPEEVVPKYSVAGLRFVRDQAGGFRMAYVDVAATRERVYALFSGQGPPNVAAADEVHVFTWQGDLVAVLGLDQLVNWMAVNEAGDRLYGVQLEPYPTIREYEMPAFGERSGEAR